MSTEVPDNIVQLHERQKALAASNRFSEFEFSSEAPKETDLGNAQRMAALFGGSVRYCNAWGKWLLWNEQRWEIDRRQNVDKLAVETVKSIYAEAAATSDADRRIALAKHARKSEDANRLKSMLRLLPTQPGISITPEELDADKWLLNVLNGTINLRTGELLEHDREHLITKIAPVTYDPDAKCPHWMAFLNRVMDGNKNLLEFIQRAVGYNLTGDVSEQVLFFLHGSGSNGKSTFIQTILRMLGDYAKQSESELLLARRGEVHPTGIADLQGARFVASSEIESGRRLAESLVKQLTGGDRLKARYMRQDFFEFEPSHKLWLAANHKPIIRNSDYGIWRRIRLIPFTVTIPDDEKDPQLPDKLLEELPGILNWAIAGCLTWQSDGLGFPPEVGQAVQDYRDEQDTLSGFFDERCKFGTGEWVAVSALYKSYLNWCEANDEKPLSKIRLGEELRQRFPKVQSWPTKHERRWAGIGVKTDIELEFEQNEDSFLE